MEKAAKGRQILVNSQFENQASVEKYTEEVCVKIQEYYKSIEPNLNIFVFDYNELKTQFKSIE